MSTSYAIPKDSKLRVPTILRPPCPQTHPFHKCLTNRMNHTSPLWISTVSLSRALQFYRIQEAMVGTVCYPPSSTFDALMTISSVPTRHDVIKSAPQPRVHDYQIEVITVRRPRYIYIILIVQLMITPRPLPLSAFRCKCLWPTILPRPPTVSFLSA